MRKEVANNLLNLVKNNYNEIAVNFNITRKKEIWSEVKNLTENIKKGSKILDVGCGNGRLLETLMNRDIHYLGIDNSQELIKLAQQNYPNHHFLVSDILNLVEVTEDNFDYIFCLAVLPHIPGEDLRAKALTNLQNKLGPSGQIIISAWNLWEMNRKPKNYRRLIFNTWITGWFKTGDWGKLDFGDLIFPWKNSEGKVMSKRYYHAFTMRELRRLVKKMGFVNYSLKKDKFNYWLILNKK